MRQRTETIETDVLVVGGGGAASRAAIEAARAGARVVLAVKGTYGNIGVRGSGSTAGGVSDRGGVVYPHTPSIQGFEPEGAPRLTPEKDYENILQLGLGMADPRLARVQAEEAHEAMRPLVEDWGAEVFPRRWGLMSHGVPMALALARQVRGAGVAIMEHTMVVDVLLSGGRAAGAVAVDERTGDLRVIKAGAVVLGTGGEGGMFRHHLTSACTTGDGYAMAWRAGAELMNLEFKQTFPGTVWPTVNHFSAWFFVPHVRIVNAAGERYIERYLPAGITLEEVYRQRSSHGPFSARDSASRYFDVATVIETKLGRANEHGAMCVDLTDPRVADPLVAARREYFYYRGIRYLHEPVEFNICFHCSNGGVRIDENAASAVPGLYAAGEAAAGPHGANRLAGHMLTASQVFGRRAGRHAAVVGRDSPAPDAASLAAAVAAVETLRSARGAETPAAVAADLKRLVWETMLCHVNADTLSRASRGLAEIRAARLPHLAVGHAGDLVAALELRNMVLVGEMLAAVIDLRTESRGDQYREDYAARDDANWARAIVARQAGGEMRLETEVLDPDWPASERAGDMLGMRWG